MFEQPGSQTEITIGIFWRSSIVELLDTEDVTLEQVQAVDEVVLELCSKTPDIPFYFVTN